MRACWVKGQGDGAHMGIRRGLSLSDCLLFSLSHARPARSRVSAATSLSKTKIHVALQRQHQQQPPKKASKQPIYRTTRPGFGWRANRTVLSKSPRLPATSEGQFSDAFLRGGRKCWVLLVAVQLCLQHRTHFRFLQQVYVHQYYRWSFHKTVYVWMKFAT